MNPKQRAFRRKISYLLAIAGLLLLLSLLGRPATQGTGDNQGSQGGQLAQLRKKHGLSQTQLGEIDPTSETVKLASFGLRGVAVTLLWSKRHQYQMKKDWANITAIHEQIAKLQPSFVSVWIFQSWNLAYNVSVEFDDYRKRYEWVIRGINFLRKGIPFNDRDPTLFWQVGWEISHKIGRSDERIQFRAMFREDGKFLDSMPEHFKQIEQDPRDSWLVGKQWHIDTETLFKRTHVPVKRLPPVVYLSHIPLCQMYYAEANENDGDFDEAARWAWVRAGKEWYEFGDKLLTTATGVDIRLNQVDDERKPNLQDDIRRLTKELEKLGPKDIREKIKQRKLNSLTDKQRAAYNAKEKTLDQERLDRQVRALLVITHQDVARSQWIPEDQRARARKLGAAADAAVEKAKAVRRYRSITAYSLWRHKAEMEQKLLNMDPAELRKLLGTASPAAGGTASPAAGGTASPAAGGTAPPAGNEFPAALDPAKLMIAVSARKLIYKGSEAFDQGRLKDARENYRLGSALWSKLLEISAERKAEWQEDRLLLGDAPPPRGGIVDETFAEDIEVVLNNYRIVLDKDGDLFPEDFRLKDYVHRLVGRLPDVQASRRLVDEAEGALAEADPKPKREDYVAARAKYRDATLKWRDVLNANPSVGYGSDPQTIVELLALVEQYGRILARLDEVFPEDFALGRFMRVHVVHAPETRIARESVADAENAMVEAEKFLAVGNGTLAGDYLRTAGREFAEAATEWQTVLDKFPSLLLASDRATLDELSELVESYRDTQPERKLPPDFPLRNVVDLLQRVQ